MNFRKYYGRRLFYAFHYSNKNVFYCIFKTLCMIVGAILAVPLFIVDMAITFVYMLFMWIPILNVVMLFLFRILTRICGIGFYIAIGPDLPQYLKEYRQEILLNQLSNNFDQTEQQETTEYGSVQLDGVDQTDNSQTNQQPDDDTKNEIVPKK